MPTNERESDALEREIDSGGSDDAAQAAFEHMRRETSHTRPSAPQRARDTTGHRQQRDNNEGPEAEEEGEEGEEEVSQEKGDKPAGKAKVPLGAVQEERQRRQQAERELQQMREQRAAMEERFRLINEMVESRQQPQAPDADIPDPMQNPVEYLAWTRQQEINRRQADAETQRRQQAEQQESQRYQAFVAESRRQTEEYVRSDDPDAKHFQQAYGYVKERRFKELTEIFRFHPQQAAQMVQQEEVQLLNNAMLSGENPGRAVVTLAKQWGWKRPDEQVEDDPDIKLDRIEDGRRRNASMSSSGRGNSGDTGAMTPEKWLAMDIAEAEAWASRNPAKFKRLMGG